MASEFDPKMCPVGLANSKDIEYLGERLDMAIEVLTEKVSDMKQDIDSLNTNMNNKFEKVDKRFDAMDNKIDTFKKEMDSKIESLKAEMPNEIDKEINNIKGKTAVKAWVWIFVGVGGSAVVYLVSRIVARLFGL